LVARKKESKLFIILYLLPALSIYTVFMAYPLLMSLKISLYKWSGTGPMTFVGLENFRKLFLMSPFNERFFNALTNNIKFFVITMIVQNLVALILALILSQGLKGTRFYRTIFFAPVTLSVVIVGFIWTLILNPTWGVLNKSLEFIGLGMLAKPWLGDPMLALPTIAVVNGWQYIGFPIILFTVAMQSIPAEICEAASIDGCSGWNLFKFITVPGISHVIGLVTILTLVGNFSSFEIIYAMEGTLAGPNYSSDVLGTLFYRTAFSSLSGSLPEMGLGAAIAVCMFIVISMGVGVWLYFDAKSSSMR